MWWCNNAMWCIYIIYYNIVALCWLVAIIYDNCCYDVMHAVCVVFDYICMHGAASFWGDHRIMIPYCGWLGVVESHIKGAPIITYVIQWSMTHHIIIFNMGWYTHLFGLHQNQDPILVMIWGCSTSYQGDTNHWFWYGVICTSYHKDMGIIPHTGDTVE